MEPLQVGRLVLQDGGALLELGLPQPRVHPLGIATGRAAAGVLAGLGGAGASTCGALLGMPEPLDRQV
jgi:hypothetical protein